MLQAEKPIQLPELPGNSAIFKAFPLLRASLLKKQPSYFVLPFFFFFLHVHPLCVYPQHTLSKLSIINHSLLPHVRMGFLIHSKSFGEQIQL